MGSKSIDCVYETLCNTIKAEDRVDSISQSFSNLTTDEERVKFVTSLLTEMHLSPSSNIVSSNSKNTYESTRLRNEGNEKFMKKEDLEAFSLYTRSILLAPVPLSSDENLPENMSLGFANRSAVLFKMGKIHECLQDIEQALYYKYPCTLMYKLLERKGRCYEKLNHFEEAQKCFMEASDFLSQADLSEDKRKCIANKLKELMNIALHENKPKYAPTNPPTELPSITSGQHLTIPCASRALCVSYSSDAGRYIEAAEDISPGDVLLVEKPYASVLLPEFYTSHCSLCLRHTWTPLPCLRCPKVVYCSVRCRSQAWEQSHRIECEILPALLEMNTRKFGFLALRILLLASSCGDNLVAFQNQLCTLAQEEATDDKANLGFDNAGLYQSDRYGPIYHLVGNTDKRTVGDLFERAVTAACIMDCLTNLSSFFLPHAETNSSVVGGVLLRHLQNLPCNAHEVTDYVRTDIDEVNHVVESVEIGAAAYATLSLLNHSCDPSVVRHSVAGDRVVLRALRPVHQGEQVLDNYGYHYVLHSCATRRSKLSNQYFFQCNCQPCQQDWPLYENLPSINPKYLCLHCRSLLPCNDNAPSVTCPQCNMQTDLLQLQQQLMASTKQFVQQLNCLLQGTEVPDAEFLAQHLQLLDSRVERPWKEYNDCQETLKQCFNQKGNCYRA